MRKAILVFLLLAALCFQGFAPATQMLAWERSGDASHSLMHSASVAHHHHHDGSIHKDDSKKSLQHLNADFCVTCPGVLPTGVAPLPELPVDRSGIEAVAAGHDSAFLEGLKRPPRAA